MDVQKYKHVCKFCKKSFPCGRSLGGHIRSHLPKPGYELRENPKKTWRAVHHGDVLINNSSFSSSTETENLKNGKMNRCQGKRSTFARSNSYSSVSEEVEAEQQEEIVVAMCLIMLSQDVGSLEIDITSPLVTPSENFPLSQGKNSKNLKKRREKVVVKNSAFDAVNGKKYETVRNGNVQKELKSKVSVVSASGFGSNDENSKNLESKRKREKHHGNITKIESSTCGFVKNGAKIQDFEVLRNGIVLKDQSKHPPESKRKIGEIIASRYVKKGLKIEGLEASKDELVSYNEDQNMLDTKLYSYVSKASSCYKRNKFECTTCNKVFHSYQSLGGHRASHKKHVGGPRCSPPLSTLEENGIPSTGAPPSPNDRKHSQSKQEKEQEDVQVMRIGSSSSSSSLIPSKKLVQKHECPICFRVFPSGQALGGHKRSHLLIGSNADSTGRISEVIISNSQQQQQSSIVPPKTSNNPSSKISEVVGKLETRDLLDLNFPPATTQDETTTSVTTTTSSKSTSLVGFMKPYWCAESSHKHDPLLDLISN